MVLDTRSRSKERQLTEISNQSTKILQEIKFGSIETAEHR